MFFCSRFASVLVKAWMSSTVASVYAAYQINLYEQVND